MKTAPPLERIYDLGDLSDAGYETTVAASSVEMTRIAGWEEIDGVTHFEGRIALARRSQTRFEYEAALRADIVQSCVVTLVPVKTHIERIFRRELHYLPLRHAEKGGPITLAAAEDDAPEEIESLKFDLAGPLLEEFSLAIDPYPRAPGVEFEAPADSAAPSESPFAALKALKRG